MTKAERDLIKLIELNEQKARSLREANLKSENQYSWDDWMRAEGILTGLETGLVYLRLALEEIKRK